jgi:hypothetical protein
MLFGCEEPKQVYETEIKTYVISSKEKHFSGKAGVYYYLYFQTPISTKCAHVTYDTYNKYKVGDTIQVLIKYWEKPKKK